MMNSIAGPAGPDHICEDEPDTPLSSSSYIVIRIERTTTTEASRQIRSNLDLDLE